MLPRLCQGHGRPAGPHRPGPEGKEDEAEKAAKDVEKWLFSLGVKEKLSDVGFKDSDVERLVKLTQETPSLSGLLAIAPVKATPERVAAIYRNALTSMA